jgi:hypothetical protein
MHAYSLHFNITSIHLFFCGAPNITHKTKHSPSATTLLSNRLTRALNIIANEEILRPIGVPLLVGTMLFFLTLGIAQSEHTDAKVAETTSV